MGEEGFYEGFYLFNRLNHPWFSLVDPQKFLVLLENIRRLSSLSLSRSLLSSSSETNSAKQSTIGCSHTWQPVLAHVLPGPPGVPFKSVQSRGIRSMQLPSGRQQASVRQLVVAQALPGLPRSPFMAAHSLGINVVQLPSGRQQAPSGGG